MDSPRHSFPGRGTAGRATLYVLLVALALGLALLFALLRGPASKALDSLPAGSGDPGTSDSDPAGGAALEAPPARARAGHESVRELAQAAPSEVAELDWGGVVRERGSGAAIEGALVVLRSEQGERSAVTDAQGAFELGRPSAPAALEITHADYEPLRRAEAELEPLGRFELQPAAGLVVVVRGPGPAQLATARAALFELRGDKDHRAEAREVGADDSGRFVFTTLEPGEHAVFLDVPGYASAFETRLVVQRGERHELALELSRSAWMEGRVSYPNGAPAAGVSIAVRPEWQGAWGELEERAQRTTVSDAEGSYRVEELASGQLVVTLETPWGGASRKRVEVPESGVGVQRDFEVTRSARLAGVVLDQAGRAVPEAWVSLAWEGRELFVTLGEEGARAAEGRRVARADEQGRFAFEDAPAGRRLRLFASDERPSGAGASGHAVGLRLASGEDRRDFELRLRHSARINGRVVSLSGEPVALVRVRAERKDGDRELRLAEARTDAQGVFSLRGLAPGGLKLEFDHVDYLMHYERMQLGEGGEAELEVVLAREPVLRGVVRDAGGYAVPFARVNAVCTEPAAERHGRYSKRGAWADRYGRFSFDELGFGVWDLTARAQGWLASTEAATRELPHELWVELELEPDPQPPRARVVGTLSRADGSPPTGVRFGSTRGGAVELVDGRFRMSGVAPGRMRLRIEADACVPVVLGPFELEPGSEHDLGFIALQEGTRFAVELRGTGGAKLRKARVRLSPLPLAEGGPSPVPRTATLKETRPGRYAVNRTGLGRYRLRVDCPGFQRSSQEVLISAQPSQDLRVVLAPKAPKKGSGGKQRKSD